MSKVGPPFTEAQQLYRKRLRQVFPKADIPEQTDTRKNGYEYVPGHRSLVVTDSKTKDFLNKDLLTPRTNRLHRYLWLVAKQDSTHISPLNEQLVRGRRIVMTEDPELHLVWYHDRVFIKPLPKYLLSYDFWNLAFYSDRSPFETKTGCDEAVQAAKGLLRSYAFLIRHQSDFELATSPQHRLLPKFVKFSDFDAFSSILRESIGDETVAPRYRYGELRLSRLNLWTKILLQELTFRKVHHQYSDDVARFYGPLLFIFAVLSVILNAMQVALSAQPFLNFPTFNTVFSRASQIVAVMTLCIVAATIVVLGVAIAVPMLRELLYALKDLWYGKRRQRTWALDKEERY